MTKFVLAVVLAMSAVSTANAGGFVDRWVSYKLHLAEKLSRSQISPFDFMLGMNDSLNPLQTPAGAQASKTETGIFHQLVNSSAIFHFDQREFDQRYYRDSSNASGPDAPVFYYICGEAACDGIDSAVLDYARQYKGHAVALEHRFYGKSQPFPRLSVENLKYLKTENALADLANFQVYAMKEWGMTGKWIAIGGSYPGSLSAYYRQKFPKLVVGSLASSAPVQPRENFEMYDWVVNDRAGPTCANAMRKVVAILEDQLKNKPADFANSKKLFEAETVSDPGDFMYIVADMAASAVQYGMKDAFCKSITDPSKDPVESYAAAGILAFKRLGMKPVDDSFMVAKNEDPASYGDGVGTRQWMYQSCTEYGYFQNAYHDPAMSTRSSMINPKFHERICQELFPGIEPLDIRKIEDVFYKPLLKRRTKHILFTNGSIDPWATLSISAKNGNATNPNLAEFMIDGAAHCDDLRAPRPTDSTSLKAARALFTGMVSQWLK